MREQGAFFASGTHLDVFGDRTWARIREEEVGLFKALGDPYSCGGKNRPSWWGWKGRSQPSASKGPCLGSYPWALE